MKILTVVQIIICSAILTASTASAVSIPGLFNTGVNNNGERLPSGSLEQHYTLSGMASTAYVFYDGAPPDPYWPWMTASADAMWIGPSGADHDAPDGDYIYTLTLNLTGLDYTKAIISGQWSSDNASTIFLNSVSTGYMADASAGSSSIYNFSISQGFLPGINTLEFHVNNSDRTPWGNPTGLLVQNLQGEIVPEPATLLLLGLGTIILRKKR